MSEIKRINLETLPNTRDLGGFKTATGHHIKPQRLIRSGTLFNLNNRDTQILLLDYQLKAVVDFRTTTERNDRPDPEFPGVTYHLNPIMDERTMGITRERHTGIESRQTLEEMLSAPGFSSVNYMTDIYKTIASNQISLERYSKFFNILLKQESGSTLWHCSAGKDRVGVGTAFLLTALNVPKDIIIEDYLMTNTFRSGDFEELIKKYSDVEHNDKLVSCLKDFLGVREEYINSVFSIMEKTSGSADAFLNDRLGLSDDKRARLEELYLD